MNAYLKYREVEWNLHGDTNSPQLVMESGGRVCYQSWANKGEKTTDQYINQQLIGHNHGSVLEQAWFTFMVADLPRSTQLELVRHGDGTAFSFESTRFTDEHLRYIAPPHIRNDPEELEQFSHDMIQVTNKYFNRMEYLTHTYKELYPDDKTLARKRAKEGARAILPMCQGSDGEVGMNARALRWIIQARTDEHADLSIREFGYALYTTMKEVTPALFMDAHEVDVREGTPMVEFDHPKV